MQDVAYDRAGGRGHHPDAMRDEGDRFFAGVFKKAFGGEPGLELFKGLLQSPDAQRLDGLDNKLVLAARRINPQTATAKHLNAVFQFKVCRSGSAVAELPEIDRPDLAFFVFECEIDMARTGAAQVGDFAFHPKRFECLFQEALDVLV